MRVIPGATVNFDSSAPLFWFELAGVSWSEFGAGTTQAHFGHNWAYFGPFEGISSEGLIRLTVP